MRDKISTLLALLTVAASVGYLMRTIEPRIQDLRRSFDPYAPPPLSDLSPNLIQFMTLGHKHVYDDFINLWLLQTLMDERLDTNTGAMLSSIRAVIKHRPKLETLYLLSCIVLMERFDGVQYCQEITIAGLEVFPESWRLPIMQGYIHAVMLEEPAQGAAFFRMAASRPNKPAWVLSLAKRLASSENISQEDISKSLTIINGFPQAESFRKILEQRRRTPSQNKQTIPEVKDD